MAIFKAIASAALLAIASSAGWSDAFAPQPRFQQHSNIALSAAEPATPCEAPSGIDAVTLQDASPLKNAMVTNAKGELVQLGDVMSYGVSETTFDTSVVVFLRHMGIGDQEKLDTFLSENPAIDPESIFVDGYDFKAYESVGFGKFTDVDPETAKEVNLGAPDLSFGQWMGYMRSVGKVSPIPKDMKFGQIPEGVLRLGGTFVVKGDEILYQWSDRLPGDHPEIPEVLSLAMKATN